MLDAIREKVLGRRSAQNQDMHLGEPGFLRKLVRRRELESVFLFVTAKCNSKCRTCFYPRERVEQLGPDLTIDEIRRISATAGRFDKLWLSGGEPILRPELLEILTTFHRDNGVQTVNFPTNGLAGDKVEQHLEQLFAACPELNVYLNFSLDGLGETHDRIRGVPGGFAKTTETIERIERRFGDNKKLQRNVATVLNAENIDEAYALATYLLKRFRLSTHFCEVMRGDPRDPELARPSRPQVEALHQRLQPIYDEMGARLFSGLPIGSRDIARFFFVGVLRALYRLQVANLDGPTPWGMDCTAGETTLVVDHNGDFRACEMRPPVGNLRDYDFDLRAAHRSPAMRAEIAAIGGGARANCWCTHTCWMLASMKFSPKAMLLDVGRGYLAARRDRAPFSVDAVDLAELQQRYQLPS